MEAASQNYSCWESTALHYQQKGSKREQGTIKQPVFGILCQSGKVFAELVDKTGGILFLAEYVWRYNWRKLTIKQKNVANYLFSFVSENPFISEVRTVHMDPGPTHPMADWHLTPNPNSDRTILYYDDWEPALNNDIQYGLMTEVPLGSVF